MHGSVRSLAPPVVHDVAEGVGLLLAGLAGREEIAARLGIGGATLEVLLHELSLTDCAMMPVGVDRDLSTAFVDMGDQPFDAPTYDDSIDRATAADDPGRRIRFRLPARAVTAATPPVERPVPGFMLHVGRCGSTLLCNLLAATGGRVALREPEFLNTLFLARAATRDPAQIDRIDTLVTRLIACLAHGVRPRDCLVKFSSWTTALAAPLIAAIVGARVIVVVRDPAATVASFLAQPPYWYGDRPARGPLAGAERARAARFFAQSWQSVMQAAQLLPRDRTLFVRYEDIVRDPSAMVERARRHLGDTAGPPDRAALDRVMALYSKGAAAEPFDRSGRHKRAALDRDLLDQVAAVTACDWDVVRAIMSA